MKLFEASKKTAVFRAFAASLGLFLCCLPALPQLNLGRIYGAVADQTGAVVPGVMVTVTDVARSVANPDYG
jgi:hypothetical protein